MADRLQRTQAGRVAVVGSFNVDHVWRVAALPQAGATLGGEYASGPGGKGFNQAMAACRAGAGTSFVCALGGDLGAQLARALCAADGIDLRDAESSAPTGTAGIYVDAGGRNCIVVGAGANAALEPEFVANALTSLDGVAVVLAQLESPLDAITHALEQGRARGATGGRLATRSVRAASRAPRIRGSTTPAWSRSCSSRRTSPPGARTSSAGCRHRRGWRRPAGSRPCARGRG